MWSILNISVEFGELKNECIDIHCVYHFACMTFDMFIKLSIIDYIAINYGDVSRCMNVCSSLSLSISFTLCVFSPLNWAFTNGHWIECMLCALCALFVCGYINWPCGLIVFYSFMKRDENVTYKQKIVSKWKKTKKNHLDAVLGNRTWHYHKVTLKQKHC